LFLWKSVYVGIYCKAFGTACSHQWNPFVAEDNYVTIYRVTVDGFWIGNQIYCALIHTTYNYK
jgi:hypothetical protein